MNTQQYFTHLVKKGIICTFLTFITLFSLKAQCNLIPLVTSSPLTVPTTATCKSFTLTPNSFLVNLASNCPDGIGTTYNLKIYNAAGTVAIYDFNNFAGSGSAGAFPILDIAALGLSGQTRKIRIERLPSGQSVEMNAIFQVGLSCVNATLEANDDMTLNNPALLPNSASTCPIPYADLCIIGTVVTPIPCATPGGNYQTITRVIKSGTGSTNTCNQTLTIKKVDITTISFPANYTDPSKRGCAFTVSYRHPNVTGFPLYKGAALALATATSGVAYTIGNAEITFTDVLQTGTCSGEIFYKRTWTVKDLCAASPMQIFVQDIRSKETQSPTIQPLANVTINTANTSCSALNFQVPTAIVADNCSTPTVSILITNASTSLTTTNGGTVPSLVFY